MSSKLLQGLLIACMIILCSSVYGQVSRGGTPISMNKSLSGDIQTILMDPVDVDAYLAEDAMNQGKDVPYRTGAGFDVHYTLTNSGTWTELADGGHIWRLRIESPGAYYINLLYDFYYVPEGATLFIYNEGYKNVIGAFTSDNIKSHGKFATAPVPGDVTILEYYEPANVRGRGDISINRVVHGYKDIFNWSGIKEALGFGSSGSCNNNVNCPEGEPWLSENRGVALVLLSNGSAWCSGSMINNVREDETPYFLTANHCLGSEETWIFMFRYESPTCSNINGPTNYTVSGSTLLANSSTSDFGLLLLDEAPPESYNIYFNGWSNINTPSTNSVGIHHPAGDIKKISFDDDPTTSADYLQTSGTTHWRIGSWDDGTTEGGSSGSPLFDQNHRIIGQLHGGYASCTSITSDWYGKFAVSWDGSSSSNRLRDYLDPDNTGATTLDGYDPYAGTKISHTPLPNTTDTVNNYEVVANIKSVAALNPDSLLLYYQLGATWYTEVMTSTGATDEYSAFIPAQSAGTVINYYLFASDVEHVSDTTDIFTFSILYVPNISISPMAFYVTLEQGQTSNDALIVENIGETDLTYDISVVPLLDKNSIFEDLQAADMVEPANRDYSEMGFTFDDAKGADNYQPGFPVNKNAGGPDTYGYYWIDSDEPGGPVYSWYDISGVGTNIVAGLQDDNYIGPYTIGFDFPFYGNNQSEIYIGSNGIIGFDSAEMDAHTETTLPNAAAPNNILAWMWDDLNPLDDGNEGAAVYIYSTATQCIIQFNDYPEYRGDPGDVLTAQVILDIDGTITYQYQYIDPGVDILSCAVGIENADGSDGTEVIYHTDYLHDNLAIQFYMPFHWMAMDSKSGSIPAFGADTIGCSFETGPLDPGVYHTNIVVSSNDPDPADNPITVPAELTVNAVQLYMCGDANGDEAINVADAVYLINFVFKGGAAPDPMESGDANCDGDINVADGVYIINYVFKGGAEPCCP